VSDYILYYIIFILRVFDYILTVSFGYTLHCVCFNLYCGGFILFCNVCVSMCMCGFCNVLICVCVDGCVGFVMCRYIGNMYTVF